MTSEPLNRREFTTRIAGGAAVPLVAAAAAATNDVVAQTQKSEAANASSQVEKLLELVRQQYPDKRLDDAAIAEIREELEAQVARSARLSAFPLRNADEPGFAFRAFRSGA